MRTIRRIVVSVICVGLTISMNAVLADIYVVAADNNGIVIFNDMGEYSSTVALPAAAGSPGDIAQAPNGDIFVLRTDGTVQRLDSGLNFIGSWFSSGRTYGINVDSAGLVYVSGSGSSSIAVYNASGVLQTTLTPSGNTNLRDSVQLGAHTWVTNFDGPRIDVLDGGGTDIGDISSTDSPFGIQLAPNGDVWQVAQNSHEVRRTTPGGGLALSFDGDHGPNGTIEGQLRYLGVGPDGNIYIPHREGMIVDVYTETGSHVFTLSHPTMNGPDGILATGTFEGSMDTAAIPSSSTWSLVLMLLLLTGAGMFVIRRTSR